MITIEKITKCKKTIQKEKGIKIYEGGSMYTIGQKENPEEQKSKESENI